MYFYYYYNDHSIIFGIYTFLYTLQHIFLIPYSKPEILDSYFIQQLYFELIYLINPTLY